MGMRKINTRHFHLATRTTAREVNRQIVLNLIRENQPISRADLARRMRVRRSAVTTLVRELVQSGAIYERGTVTTNRGRRPTQLYVRTRGRLALAADLRPRTTYVAIADFGGRIIARESFPTPVTPAELVEELAIRADRLRQEHAGDGPTSGDCEGMGFVVPGMVDRRTGRMLYAPILGWRDAEFRGALAERLSLPVYVESAPIACAMARLWLAPEETRGVSSFAYVHVSDGVGVGLVLNGEPLRGEAHTAGEFGHVSLDPNGPLCVCGKRGCWEAFACNSATVARYSRRVLGGQAGAGETRARGRRAPSLDEVVRRGLSGEPAAAAAIADTGTYIGRGLATVVNAFNPGRIYLGGEITAAWELLQQPIRDALVAGTLTDAAMATPVVADGSPAEYRLLGAVALVAAPTFAAPTLA